MKMTQKLAQAIVKDVNDVRKQSRDTWYIYEYKPLGLKLKGYKTWIQRIELGNFIDGSPMNMPVTKFKEWLTDWLIQVGKHNEQSYR